MVKFVYIFLTLLSPLLVLGQNLDVEGAVKLTDMTLDNSVDTVVVRLTDGTLALREVSTLSELQVLSISNDTVYLSDGGFVKLPAGFDGQYSSLTGAPTDVSAFANDVGYLTTEMDSSVSNELQVISLNNDTVYLSDGGFVKLPAGFDGQYSSLTGAPTDVSAFANDAGYLTTEMDSSNTNEIQTLAQVLLQDSSANNSRIKDLSDPIAAQDAATKAYVDSIKLDLEIELGTKVQDVDGNSYNTTKIGLQRWMAENLRTTKYNDGTSISLVTGGTAWANLTTPGYCYFDNDPGEYSVPYGALYNYYVVADTSSLNVCPEGWHVPTRAEWDTLTTYLGGLPVAGGKMKETGTFYWDSNNVGATNETDFSGLPGGHRFFGGTFNFIGSFGYWWSSTESTSNTNALYLLLYYDVEYVGRFADHKRSGFSVRCLKDD